MMYLKVIEVAGFKSFAKKTDLEFSTAITGIVGPNGSGKSNIAEAFRFVLGEQSIKSLRGKRGEDLIFNGSPSAARANRASVKIVLDNTKKVFPLDFTEISIERVVNRDGVNEYSINGSRTRLKDVQELLASANIGPTGHHIISQGEADRILSATPRERREMIEDALGLKIFQFKKAESERKLAKTEENVVHVESLRREVAPHLAFLGRQVKKMEKAIELRVSLAAFYAEYLRREDEYVATNHDALTEARRAPVEELQMLEKQLVRAKAKLVSAEKDEKRDALVSLESHIRDEREKRQDILRESGKVEGEINYVTKLLADVSKVKENIADVQVPLKQFESVIRIVESDASRAHPRTASGTLLSIIESMVRTLRSFMNDVARQGSERVDKTKEYETELAILEKRKKAVEEKIIGIEEKENKLRDEYEALKKSIEAEQSDGRMAEREVFEIMGRERELEHSIGNIDRELAILERDRADFKRELEEAVILVGRAASDYFTFEIKDESGNVLSREAILGEDRAKQTERRRELEKMKIRLEELGGAGGSEMVKEYNDAKARDEFLAREIEDLQKSVASLQSVIAELTQKLNEQFVTGIEKISAEFNTFFGMMFGGGTAGLVRVAPRARKARAGDEVEEIPEDGEDIAEEIEEGIDVNIKLAHKRIKGLEMLSGGERALTSIALIFAMSQVNPPLFVILDETDAALDEANSKRYGDMVVALAIRSQLILITHNRETMSRAGVLYGVTMGADGVSKLLSVKFDEAVAVAK